MRQVIALESRLRNCPAIITLGVHPNFEDYTTLQQQMILGAHKIYYPTALYAQLLDAMGKATFPSYHSYLMAQDKIKQTALFKLRGIPHPRTRVFYGKRQQSKITHYFKFPFIAKVARGSSLGRGVRMISNGVELADYCKENHAAYIQKYLPIDRDIRVVVIGGQVVHAYWRIAPPHEFRSNLATGGTIRFDRIPEAVLRLAVETARGCRWDDVGIDICCHQGRYFVLEGNMKYGKQGFAAAGMDYMRMMSNLIHNRII